LGDVGSFGFEVDVPAGAGADDEQVAGGKVDPHKHAYELLPVAGQPSVLPLSFRHHVAKTWLPVTNFFDIVKMADLAS